jgi:hypothetical protein
MNTFTAQDLADFYQQVADGGEVQIVSKVNLNGWSTPFVECGPSIGSYRSSWRIKQTKKVIDLSVLIDSQIDCEFSDDGIESRIGKLLSIKHDGTFRSEDWVWDKCQPRMNHIHAWQGGECPIEGFVVRAWIDKEDFLTVHTSSNSINWSKIMYVEFLEVEDGYVMPWEGD